MKNGIKVRILGDSGPFSKGGKSIGYLISIGDSNYILDCGSPLFQQLGDYGLRTINGLIITHCHDDHKRWFTDLSIFYKFATKEQLKVPLFTTNEVSSELCKMAKPPLDRSLSDDSKTIIDISCSEYIDFRTLGPLPKYRISSLDKGNGLSQLCVIDEGGNPVGPDKAKIVISNKTGRMRMLFRDPEHNEWIEPESFYTFSSDIFYSENKNVLHDREGFTVEAIKAPVWHGIPNFAVKFSTENESLIFSSDTVNDVSLWKELYTEKKPQKLNMSKKEFESASIIHGDINDYIERIWSEQRFKEAINSFNNSIVIHDITIDEYIVHTAYNKLKNTTLIKDKTILTHSPDTITSEWRLCSPGKEFRITKNELFEIVNDRLYTIDADVYHKQNGQYFVGFKNSKGKYAVYEKNGILGICEADQDFIGNRLFRVDLYQDIAGGYYPKLEDDSSFYIRRRDGRVELIKLHGHGSTGTIVEDHRERLIVEVNEKTGAGLEQMSHIQNK